MNPFDFLKAINETKEDLIVDDVTEREYNAFIVNRGLSFFIDTIMYVNEMNQLAHLDNKLQFDYYINSIRRRKRFSKWHKKIEDEDVSAIMKCYGYNIEKAKQAAVLLSDADKKEIRERVKEE